VYGQKEIERAKVIRTLRAANYSLMAILRMLKAVDAKTREPEILEIVSNPQPDEDMIYVTDRLIHSLVEIEKDANEIILQIQRMLGESQIHILK
jgi:DNA-binding transcriptional MerR regulator